MHLENFLFEVQNAVVWRAVMSRGPDERTQMHSMIYPLSTMSNRELIDDGEAWVLQGTEQQQRDRAAGAKPLFSLLATTASGRAKELVKLGLSDRNGMIAIGRARDCCGKNSWCNEAHCCVPVPVDLQ